MDKIHVKFMIMFVIVLFALLLFRYSPQIAGVTDYIMNENRESFVYKVDQYTVKIPLHKYSFIESYDHRDYLKHPYLKYFTVLNSKKILNITKI